MTSRFFAALFDGAEWADPWNPLPLPKFRETNILLLLRALANAFKEDTTIGDGAWVKLVCLHLVLDAFLGMTYRVASFCRSSKRLKKHHMLHSPNPKLG